MNRLLLLFLSLVLLSCRDVGVPGETPVAEPISTDGALFALVTQAQPFSTYPLFPGVDSVASGTLNGSSAHRPLVRVRMNAVARTILKEGKFPDGGTFPDGSILFKEIISGETTVLYAIIYRDRSNPLAASGWLWAEYRPNGDAFFSITERGGGCVGCHMREQGPRHDLVRTFERQR